MWDFIIIAYFVSSEHKRGSGIPAAENWARISDQRMEFGAPCGHIQAIIEDGLLAACKQLGTLIVIQL